MNVIFDANYFGYRALHVVKNYSKSKVFLETEQDKIDFIKKLKNDFLYELNKISKDSNIEHVIFAMDGKSWRKELLNTYKGSRKEVKERDVTINYDIFYDLLNKFVNYVENEYGVIKTSIYNAEADDLIYFWSKYFLSKNQNNIIITVDKDLYQLVEKNENGNFTIVYNNHSFTKAIIINDEIEDILKNNKSKIISIEESLDGSDSNVIYQQDINIINSLCQGDLNFQKVDKEELICDKIFLGDKSDEIENVLVKHLKDPKKKKPLKINRKHLKLLKEFLDRKFAEYSFLQMHTNYELRCESSNFLSNLHKLDDNERMLIKENITLNSKLIILDFDNFPENIQPDFIKHLNDLKKNEHNLQITKLINATNEVFFENVLGLKGLKDESSKIEMYFEM